MDYVQLTLDDWMELKQKIKKELVSVKKSFVRMAKRFLAEDQQKKS